MITWLSSKTFHLLMWFMMDPIGRTIFMIIDFMILIGAGSYLYFSPDVEDEGSDS